MKNIKKELQLVLQENLALNADIAICNDNSARGAGAVSTLEIVAYLTGLGLNPGEIEEIFNSLGSKNAIIANLFDKVQIVCPSDLRTRQCLILKKEYKNVNSIKSTFRNRNQSKLYNPSALHNTTKKYVLDITPRSIKPITAKIFDRIEYNDTALGKIPTSEKLEYRIERIKLAKMYYNKLNK